MMTQPLSAPVTDYRVVAGYTLTPEFLAQEEIYYDVRYRRHPNGGGYVATTAYVPDNLFVPPTVRIGPQTRLLDDGNLAGQAMVRGDFANGNLIISRKMTGDDHANLRDQQARRRRDADAFSHITR